MCDTNKPSSVRDIQKLLLHHLTDNDRVEECSQKFAVLERDHARVDYAFELLEEYNLFPDIVEDLKNRDMAIELRQKGNEMFKKKSNKEALELYTQCIAIAPDISEEIALGYANRSAVLLDSGLYKECLEDITRALSNPYPEHLKPKLINRQNKAEELKHKQKYLDYYQPIPDIESLDRNPNIECASNAIEIKYTEDLGRHVVAKRDIAPGEILAIEKPYTQILIDDLWVHCHYCLRSCFNPIPCNRCTTIVFCGENCRELAEKYHEFECRLSKLKICLGLDKLKLIALRIALVAKDEYNNIWNQANEVSVYQSSKYDEIHKLIANTEKRTVPDLFERASVAAILFYCIKSFTNFFQPDNPILIETSFKEILLRNLQTGPCNFHEISEMVANEDGNFAPAEIGTGCYSFLSMLNHSCTPNVLRNCYGTTIVLRCLETIREGDQCFDNYAYHYALMTRPQRQKNLKQQYFFDCNCVACEENWPLYEDLPFIQKEEVYVPSTDLEDLQMGYLRTAKRIWKQHACKLPRLEMYKPSKNLAELQEVIKQCYALLGNVQRIV